LPFFFFFATSFRSTSAGLRQYGILRWDGYLIPFIITTADQPILLNDPTQQRHGEQCLARLLSTFSYTSPSNPLFANLWHLIPDEPIHVGLVASPRPRNPTDSSTPSHRVPHWWIP
jgi:hypothetical protein